MKQVIVYELMIGDSLYNKALELRYQLFFQEHGLAKEIVIDKDEIISRHFVIANKQSLIAYGRLTNKGNDEYQISQLVVALCKQGKGYGGKIIRALIMYAQDEGAKRIVLNARITATKLYLKCGFMACGSEFRSKKTGIPHIKMQLILA